MMERLSVIALGKLGLPMAVLFASKGFKVIGVDVNSEIIKEVNEKRCPIYEPGVPELLENSGETFMATDDYGYAIENSEASFIVVPTPSEGNGAFSTKYVKAAGEKMAEKLSNKDDFHLIGLVSTVLPGGTATLKEVLEKVSGKKCGTDFGLCYSPEFIALGSVLRGLSNPDLLLIGESDQRSGEMLSGIYRKVCENNPPVVRTNFYNAELGKILLNAYITMKISFANTAAEICERMEGGDVDEISRILGCDSRIGRKYLSGGLGFGGPCFPRDNRAVAHFADSVGVDLKLAKTTDAINRYQNQRIIRFIEEKIGELEGKRIAILGLTYKPDTDVVEESAALGLTKNIAKKGAEVSVYDPQGMNNAEIVLGKSINYTTSVKECLGNAELCILATPWQEFKSLKPEDFVETMKKPVIFDCWRIFERSKIRERLEYLAIGLEVQ